ncbi:MAG: hypothetical protein C5B54_09755 [Acidobacteria bacterium]|nr:MAG: hypothetical protein C5B54_09755 [Acidobacteriota bacterium]
MKSLSDSTINHLKDLVSEPDLSGTQYRLIHRIGQGGMATVYLVYDTRLEREVALKVLNVPDASGELISRLVSEAKVLARLEHPGIIPIHDVGTLPDQRVYYVMKYVHGRRLDEQATLLTTTADRMRIMQRICEPVSFAHSQGVIHRDLKPENIMVGAFGEVLIMDWGIAKILGHGVFSRTHPQNADESLPAHITGHGTILGTPAYMSPEQAKGEIDTLKESTDIYALGAILYFLLTGSPPVHSTDSVITPPREINKKIPKAAQAICLKAMAPTAQARYQSAEEMQKEIDRFLDGLPVKAYPENPFEIAGRWMSRNYFLVILILSYLFIRTLLLYFTGR